MISAMIITQYIVYFIRWCYLSMCIYYDIYLNYTRYYKNSVNQKPGWHDEIISWCKREAERQNLKDHEYWGSFVIDEMKIQVWASYFLPNFVFVHLKLIANFTSGWDFKTFNAHFLLKGRPPNDHERGKTYPNRNRLTGWFSRRHGGN